MFGLNFTSARGMACPATAYRLRAWPDLPESVRTAAVYQAFSRMSQGPVTLQWFIVHSRLAPQQAHTLFERLTGDGQIEIIDIGRFHDREAIRH
jgi:hypothetical protein